ncbi:DNA polymerase subunit delta-2 [Sporothrix brasiliensis 5110]|uniref:DNA polymerase subunit delta-2 n=1 Tax=Sporothrix brasiliensis 5110 TaxID=1398154 RepID=A0A0C2FBA0_9PEZI|nr:DNA polymerase subunit delta-2 [Sporothrix brasiliensis 5110]KIH88353.1 DNA polymerase subunit delta-2 [Sporothrix brasiliensis 5110]
MKVNENTAISTPGVLLVPYDRRHVPTYHDWMEDEAVRAATASDRLTLEEEFENQASWRAAADKLTFILCQPATGREGSIVAGVDDAPDRMVGDINFFLTPFEADEDEDDESGKIQEDEAGSALFSGEVDVMIARPEHRRQGFGRSAVTAFLHYILQSKRDAILAEAADATTPAPRLKQLVVKIQASNLASISLFTSLGFEQKGGVNYFGEVELVRKHLTADAPPCYTEKAYQRRDSRH